MMAVGTESERPAQVDDFRGLLVEYQNKVYNQAYRMLGNHEDAEEAAQDIFLKVYHSLEQFRGESKLSTWIYRITANECISRLRKKQIGTGSFDEPIDSEGRTLGDIIPDSGPDPCKTLESTQTAEIIRDHVRRLPPDWAMAISLYHFDDLSYDEIADIMNIPRATVGIYIMRGRRRLAKWLAGVL